MSGIDGPIADLEGPDGLDGDAGWSENRPDRNGWWEWREGGRDKIEKILLTADGNCVADDDEWGAAMGRSPEHKTYSENYWEGTDTTQQLMPGLWRFFGPVVCMGSA
jgi:hypothetical protein